MKRTTLKPASPLAFIMASVAAGFFLLAGTVGHAQQYSYKLTRGKVENIVKWTEEKREKGKTITIEPFPGRLYTQNVDEKCRTLDWHFTCRKDNTDIRITLKAGVYSIAGRHKGKAIDKTVKSAGKPWYQNISYASEHLLKKEGDMLEYECFRPDNLEMSEMTARIVGRENVNGILAADIKVSPAGRFAKMWSCHYYIDIDKELMVCYKAVEGLPGTPLTTWMLIK